MTPTSQARAIKETGILFTPENVRKVLAGTKTQTRRIVKGKQLLDVFNFLGGGLEGEPGQVGIEFVRECECTDEDTGKKYLYTGLLACCGEYPEEGYTEITCPYGQPGDRLWVREAWAVGKGYDGVPGSKVPSDRFVKRWYLADGPKPKWCGRTRSSRFMPKRFARLWLEIVSVKVERLQEISEDDCYAEGIARPQDIEGCPGSAALFGGNLKRCEFRELWKSIHGPESWDANPWVWRIEFKRVMP